MSSSLSSSTAMWDPSLLCHYMFVAFKNTFGMLILYFFQNSFIRLAGVSMVPNILWTQNIKFNHASGRRHLSTPKTRFTLDPTLENKKVIFSRPNLKYDRKNLLDGKLRLTYANNHRACWPSNYLFIVSIRWCTIDLLFQTSNLLFRRFVNIGNQEWQLFIRKERCLADVHPILSIKKLKKPELVDYDRKSDFTNSESGWYLDNCGVAVSYSKVIVYHNSLQVFDNAALQVSTTAGLYSCIDKSLKKRRRNSRPR